MAQRRKVVRPRRASRAPFMILITAIFVLSITLTSSFVSFIAEDMSMPNVNKLALTVKTMYGDSVELPAIKETADMYRTLKLQQPKDETDEDVVTERVKAETWVAETKMVDDSYFDDAVFIGDSVSVGLRVYGVVPKKNVLAAQNVGITSFTRDYAVYTTTGSQKKTVFDAIPEAVPDPGKIYILIGANSMPGLSNKAHIEYYAEFLDRLQAAYPETIIYVESLTPLAASSSYIRNSFNKTKINEFNDMLYELAKEKGIYFLNVEEALMDKNGNLISDYDAGDGLHLKSNGHKAMYRYYRKHAVQPDGYIEKVVK